MMRFFNAGEGCALRLGGVVGRVRGQKAWTMRNEGEHEHEVMAGPTGPPGAGVS